MSFNLLQKITYTETETRDVVDSEDVVIGSLTLPVGSAEEKWQAQLEIYAAAQPFGIYKIIKRTIKDAIAFGNELQENFIIENVAMGITHAGKTKIVSDYLRQLERYIQQGSLYAACEQIDFLIANTVPSELAPFVTPERLTDFKKEITDYLGV